MKDPEVVPAHPNAKQRWAGKCRTCASLEAKVKAHDASCTTCQSAETRVSRCDVGRDILDAETDQLAGEVHDTPHWEPIEKGAMNRKTWEELPLRTCNSLHYCKLCGKDITLGQQYRDGGYKRRAHLTCIAEFNRQQR